MLDDLKSFFVTTSVVEVGVGVTIGVAFAALVGAVTDSGRALLSGEPEWSGLVQAVLTLLTVAAVSVFGIVRPLAALKRRMTEVQSGAVAEAVQQAREGELGAAASTAARALSGAELAGPEHAGATDAPGATHVEPLGTAEPSEQGAVAPAALQGAEETVAPATSGAPGAGGEVDAHALDAVLAGDGVVEDLSVPPTEPVSEQLDAERRPGLDAPADQDAAQGEQAAVDAPGRVLDPLSAPLASFAAAAAPGSNAPEEGAPGTGSSLSTGSSDPALATAAGPGPVLAAGAVAPAGRAPHGHPGPPTSITELAPCPYCAFDIPAVATRCGWCTSELGELGLRTTTPV